MTALAAAAISSNDVYTRGPHVIILQNRIICMKCKHAGSRGVAQEARLDFPNGAKKKKSESRAESGNRKKERRSDRYKGIEGKKRRGMNEGANSGWSHLMPK